MSMLPPPASRTAQVKPAADVFWESCAAKVTVAPGSTEVSDGLRTTDSGDPFPGTPTSPPHPRKNKQQTVHEQTANLPIACPLQTSGRWPLRASRVGPGCHHRTGGSGETPVNFGQRATLR